MMRITSGILVLCMASVALAEVETRHVQTAEGAAIVVANDEATPACAKVHVVHVGANATADAPDCEKVVVVKAIAEDGKDGNVPFGTKYRVISRVGRAQDANRGWLGVALGECVTEDSDDGAAASGVVVLNVVKDSPAADAGLQENDVIVGINGESVDGGVAGLAKLIGDLGPDAKVDMEVIRDGETIDLSATLSSPQGGSVEWLYAPDFTTTERIQTIPHIGKFTTNGMKFFSPDELHEMQNLPDMLIEMLSPSDTTTQLSIENGQRRLKMVTNENGNIIEISQSGDGPITVKRYTEGSDDAEEAEYATAEDLQAADEEAYEIYSSHQKSTVWIGRNGDAFNFDFDVNVIPDPNMSDDTRRQIEESMKSAQEAIEKLQQQGGAFTVPLPPPHRGLFFSEKATRSFKVMPDGQIELTIRKGDSEVIKVYADEADLQARDPETYERYRDVLDADVE